MARRTLVVDCGACLPLMGNCHLGIGGSLRSTAINRNWVNQKLCISQSFAKLDETDRPTQPNNETQSMNHASDTHPMNMGVR